MKNLFKQCVGIDISNENFDARFCRMDTDQELSFSSPMKFDNNKTGFKKLLSWIKQQTEKGVPVHIVMEATGVYYEALAYYLHEQGFDIHVLLPNKSKHFIGSLNGKSKNDRIEAKHLAQFGVERKFDSWQPPPPFYKKLRSLTRYYNQLQEQKTALLNMLHSHEICVGESDFVVKNIRQLINKIKKQIEECDKQIKAHIKSDKEVSDKIKNVCTIKGVAITTAAIVIAETFGFHLFNSSKQLTSYTGYDVVEKQSGTSVHGKTHISKKGNKYIRKAMFFPAMTYVRFCPGAKAFYNRIVERRKIKMVGQVAAQRKLLVLIYTLWKKNEPFDETKVAPAKN